MKITKNMIDNQKFADHMDQIEQQSDLVGWTPPFVVDYEIQPADKDPLNRDACKTSFYSHEFDNPVDPEDVIDKINYEVRDKKCDQKFQDQSIKNIYDDLTKNIKPAEKQPDFSHMYDPISGNQMYLEQDNRNLIIQPDNIKYQNESVLNGGLHMQDNDVRVYPCDPRDSYMCV